MMTDSQKVLRVVAELFAYPDAEWHARRDEIVTAIATLSDTAASRTCVEFLAYADSMDPRDFEGLYVDAFDFSKTTNLSLTSRSCNDELQQRMSLLSYSMFFEQCGFQSAGESSDHLPSVLELAAAAPLELAQRIMSTSASDIELLHKALLEAELSEYASLVAVALAAGNQLNNELEGEVAA